MLYVCSGFRPRAIDTQHCLTHIAWKAILLAPFYTKGMQNQGQGKYIVFALRAAADMTATILVPAVVAAVAGEHLDARLATGRAFFIALLVAAALLTIWTLTKKARRYGEAFKKLVGEPGNGPAGR